MRLLIVVMNYYPSVGGTQIFFQHLAEYCVRHFNFQVEVYTTDSYYGPEKDRYKKIELSREYINGVFVRRFAFRRWHRKPFLLMQKVSIKLFNKSSVYLSVRRTGPWSRSLQKAIENTDADLIVGATSAYMYMAYPLTRSRLKNAKPFIFQGAFHFDVRKENQVIAAHILHAIQKAEYYLANSNYEKEILSNMGVPSAGIEVLGSATEHDVSKLNYDPLYRQQLNLTPAQPFIAFIGRISELKSIDVLIKAMEIIHLELPDTHLVVAGDDNGCAEKLQELAFALPAEVSESIHFRLNIDEKEKNSIYNSIDLLVLPSKNESFGLVFLEAWAFKKPVIGARIGAISSIIDDGVDGILFNPDDVTHLAQCIVDALQNDDKRKQLGEAGYKKLLNNYTWGMLGGKFKSVCEKAIQKFELSAHTTF